MLEYTPREQRPVRGHGRLRVPRAAIPALRGWYVFGDYCSGEIWAIRVDRRRARVEELLRNTGVQISSFGENDGGELFVVDLGGTIYRIDHA